MAAGTESEMSTMCFTVEDSQSCPPIKREKLVTDETYENEDVLRLISADDTVTFSGNERNRCRTSSWYAGSRGSQEAGGWDASRDEIEAWVAANLEAREKCKIPSDELRQKCSQALSRTFTSRRFGEAIRAMLPNARLNNKGRAHPDQPLVSYYYGVAYKLPQTDYTVESQQYHDVKDDGEAACSSTSQDNIDTEEHGNQPQFTQDQLNGIDVLPTSDNCSACAMKDKMVADMQREITDIKGHLLQLTKDKDILETVVQQKESQLKTVQEQYSEVVKKIDIVQRVLSM